MSVTEALPKWLEKHPIVDPEHVHQLEAAAAINEFHHHMPREEAEAAAHRDYMKEQHTESASHHLNGMKTAQAAGDMEASRKHGVMYNLAMKALGHDPIGAPPQEVTSRAKQQQQGGSHYRFKAHKADAFLLDKLGEDATKAGGETNTEKSEDEETIADRLATLKVAANVALKLHDLGEDE